ncbi:unnamed protein product [Citrullus colocynthis]|uniref:Uncharacterized protein n=1 Tax=Citrullus colocynthis TaxID=252529 RepID=A0ABP0XZ14_9ROSI
MKRNPDVGKRLRMSRTRKMKKKKKIRSISFSGWRFWRESGSHQSEQRAVIDQYKQSKGPPCRAASTITENDEKTPIKSVR